MAWNILRDNDTAQMQIGDLLRLWVSTHAVSGNLRFFYEVQNGSGYCLAREEDIDSFEAAQQSAIAQAQTLLNEALKQLQGAGTGITPQ